MLRWLEEAGTRLVRTSEPWSMPAYGAGSLREFLVGGADGARAADPFADRRRLPVVSRPARGGGATSPRPGAVGPWSPTMTA